MNDAAVSVERPRGCGYRKKGGLYLIGPPGGVACGRLPMPLHTCETCGQGVKQARGWTWVKPERLLGLDGSMGGPCGNPACFGCPLGGAAPERAGLIWIGRGFYPMPEDFLAEGQRMGFSRRISGVPRGFEVGRDWILLAHARAIVTGLPEITEAPGIFAVWKPKAIQHVVDVNTSQEEVDAIRKRGHEPIIVERDEPEFEFENSGAIQ